jgi:hypothetical protein
LWLLAQLLRRIGYRHRIVDAVRHAREWTERPTAIVGYSRGGHHVKSIDAARLGDVLHGVCLGTGLESALDAHRMTGLGAAVSRCLLAAVGSYRR